MAETRRCASCGKPFAVTRSDKTYCSTACRARTHREADERTVRVREAKKAVDAFLDTATDDEWDQLSALLERFAKERKERA